jgi:hypothetical protein
MHAKTDGADEMMLQVSQFDRLAGPHEMARAHCEELRSTDSFITNNLKTVGA